MDTCRPQKNQRKLKQSEERRGVGGRRESESEWRRRWSGNGVAGEGGGSEKASSRPRQAGLRNRTLSRPKRLFHAPPLALPKSPT
ncbi:hypothetical protein SAY86_027045 [Trapa natans]|uniref:Uncharacterized protein n=1 Tax=Trapa natans TaxID=22666 RepID=A0AAN7KSE2_TRANT|nr:hypothetical protein SAY86_027045 [Trapa natans]